MMTFMLACMALAGAALVLETTDPRGVAAVRPAVWYAILAGLGVWLLVLAA